ncbi:MAG: DsbA family protein [Solirubrobacteraceae bacterium]
MTRSRVFFDDGSSYAAAISDPARREEVRGATDDAVALGVTGVPTVTVRGQLFWGDERLEDVAGVLAASG